MTGEELRELLQEEAKRKVSWEIDWNETSDRFRAGNPEAEIKGIAVSWMSTREILEEARERGANLLVTHEPLYVLDEDSREGAGPDHPWVRKKRWLERTDMMVYRCHAFWDNFPELGVHGAWAKWLGFEQAPVAARRHYEVHETGGLVLEHLAQNVLHRVRTLGQETVGVVGDLRRQTRRIALGTGAITAYKEMAAMDADVLMLTDDGTRLYEAAQWASDSGVSLLLVNHATSEEPGMKTLADYIAALVGPIPVCHLPVGCLYHSVHV